MSAAEYLESLFAAERERIDAVPIPEWSVEELREAGS